MINKTIRLRKNVLDKIFPDELTKMRMEDFVSKAVKNKKITETGERQTLKGYLCKHKWKIIENTIASYHKLFSGKRVSKQIYVLQCIKCGDLKYRDHFLGEYFNQTMEKNAININHGKKTT